MEEWLDTCRNLDEDFQAPKTKKRCKSLSLERKLKENQFELVTKKWLTKGVIPTKKTWRKITTGALIMIKAWVSK